MYSVGLGSFPIIANFLATIAIQASLSFSALFGRGELLILAAGLSATAIGDLALAQLTEAYKRRKTVLSAWAVANLLVTSFYFAFVSQGYEGGVVVVSLFAYASAVVCGWWCVKLSERGERDVRHR
jgi:4-amino-4-deoxy-L-arabinose transferase-like glycosyltransferase